MYINRIKVCYFLLLVTSCVPKDEKREPMSDAGLLLNSGYPMPRLGLGTLIPKESAAEAVSGALEVGYRHIDCSPIYGNEQQVGFGIKLALSKGISRSDIFVASKLWNTKHNPKNVEPALRETLKDLGVEYLDLYLMHWPMGTTKNDADDGVHFIDTWHAMEQLVKKSLVRSIGVSNFNRSQIEELIKSAQIKPAVLQVEYHPYLQQKDLIDYARKEGIVITAFASLGSPKSVGTGSLLTEKNVLEIASKHNKTPAQVLIRFPIENGLNVIVGSGSVQRVKENFGVVNFNLDDHDLNQLKSLEKGLRYWREESLKGHKFYPF